jgi:hypothetical protein
VEIGHRSGNGAVAKLPAGPAMPGETSIVGA